MLISILLATRNRPQWLPRAIDSVLAQTHDGWELVILDNGESVRNLVPDDPRIAYYHETAAGPAQAYQLALERATGDVVMPLADDDTLAPQAVGMVLDGIGAAQWGYAQTAYQQDGETRFLLGAPWSIERMRQDYYLGGAVFWRRSLTDRLGGFDAAYDGAADYDLYLRFGEDSEPVFLDGEVLYLYNDWPGTDTHQRPENQRAKAAAIRNRAPRRTVSIVTPWLDHPELIPDYEQAVRNADEVVIVDNGSDDLVSAELVAMLARHGYPERHRYLRWRENGWFSAPMNDGIRAATGDVIVALNNDVRNSAPTLNMLTAVRNEVTGPGLFGPGVSTRTVDGVSLPYIEGWCIAATRETWDRLGGFDAEAFERPYWEDVDLSFRAMCLGIPLHRTDWPIDHLSNTTSAVTDGAYDHSETNRLTFETRVREFLSQKEDAHAATAQAVAV